MGRVDTSGPWRAKIDGATLPVILGFDNEAPPDRARVLAKQQVCRAGQVVNDPLEEQFVERWENGEPHARSLVDRLDGDGNVVGGSEPTVESATAEAEAASAEAQTLGDQLDEAKQENDRLAEELERSQQDLANAQAQDEAGGESGGEAGDAAGGEQPTAPDGGGGSEYDPGEYHAEDVVTYLQNASDEEVARVKKAEEAGKGRSTILNFERSVS